MSWSRIAHILKTHLKRSIVISARHSSVFDELPLDGVHTNAQVVLELDVFGYSRSNRHYSNAVHDKTEAVKSTFSVNLIQESNMAGSNQLEITCYFEFHTIYYEKFQKKNQSVQKEDKREI